MNKRLIILDRDGTINIDRHYLSNPNDLEFLPGAAEGLRLMAASGFHLAIATNQSGIGRGYFTLETLNAIHKRLLEMLAFENVHIETIAFCPHTPDVDCCCRKPKPDLAKQIVNTLDIILNDSEVIVIGDRESDIGLARAIDAKSILITSDQDNVSDFGQSAFACNLIEAAHIIKQWYK
ncbi:MAG: HAD family hydrolase [Pseudomonadota bacterium]